MYYKLTLRKVANEEAGAFKSQLNLKKLAILANIAALFKLIDFSKSLASSLCSFLRKVCYKFFLFSFLFMAGLYADDININLSQKIVGMDESFAITFSSKGSEKPDFSPLTADFDISSNHQTHNTTIINGKFNQETRWSLVLTPKRIGKVTIPSIAFGSHQSPPVEIEVTAEKTNFSDESIFLETEVTPKDSVFQKSQLIYTVRLYHTANLREGRLSEVSTNDPHALIEKLGDDATYEA